MIALTVALVALSYIFYFREGLTVEQCKKCTKKTCSTDEFEKCFNKKLGEAHRLGFF